MSITAVRRTHRHTHPLSCLKISRIDRQSRMFWGRVSSSCCCYGRTFLSVSINHWETFGCLSDSQILFFLSPGSLIPHREVFITSCTLGWPAEERHIEVLCRADGLRAHVVRAGRTDQDTCSSDGPNSHRHAYHPPDCHLICSPCSDRSLYHHGSQSDDHPTLDFSDATGGGELCVRPPTTALAHSRSWELVFMIQTCQRIWLWC